MRSLLVALRRQMPPATWSRGVSLHRGQRVSLLPRAGGAAAGDEVELQVMPLAGGTSRQVVLYLADDEWECDCHQDACEHAAAAAIAYFQNLEAKAAGAVGELDAPAAAGAPAQPQAGGAAGALPHASGPAGAPGGAAARGPWQQPGQAQGLGAGLGGEAGRRPAALPLRQAAPHAHVAYAFSRVRGSLSLARLAVAGNQAKPLGVAIKVRQKQAGEPPLLVEASDMAIDAALAGRRLPEVLPAPLLQRILRGLLDAPHVTLDGRSIEVGEARPEQVARISRQAGGDWLLQLGFDARVKERFANGAAIDGLGHLAPLVPLFLPARESAALQAGRTFRYQQLPELLDEVLPRLARQIPLAWHQVSEPARLNVAPTISFAVTVSYAPVSEPGTTPMPTLVVVPQIVYGQPPLARVQQGHMLLTAEAVPRRAQAQEAHWTNALQQELQMACGQATTARGDAGAALLARVQGFGLRYQAHVDDQNGAWTAFRSRRPLQARLFAEAAAADANRGPAAEANQELWFECAGETPASRPTRVSASLLLDAFRRGETTLALPDGGFAPLPLRFLQAHHTALAAFLAARHEASLGREPGGQARALPAWAQAQLGRLCEALAVVPPARAQQAWEALRSSVADEPLDNDPLSLPSPVAAWLAGGSQIGRARVRPVPPGIALRPYQARGVAWLAQRLTAGLGALLADDMGLGKTVQTLLACAGRTLIVVPTTLLANWAAESRKFCPGRTIHTYHGSARALPQLGPDDIVLTTYGVLRIDGPSLSARRWQAMVLDEAQTIKNAQSQAALAAYHVGASADGRLALSGTPLENSLGELWSLLHFCNPGLFGTQAQFASRYSQPADDKGDTGLAQALRPVMLRRRKAAVAAMLPPKIEVLLRCTLAGGERDIYDALALASRNEAAKALQAGGNMMQALEALLRLRQAACHPALLPGHAHQRRSAKLEALLASLAPAVAAGHRALVFSQWTKLLDLVEPALNAADIPFIRLDGSTKDRGEVVRTFCAAEGPPVMLVSLKAGGVGLNLTAADHVFLLDPWWNPAAEDQAADRAHRIGQVRKVMVHRLIAVGTIDEQLLALQKHKRELAALSLGDAFDLDQAGGTPTSAHAQSHALSKSELWQLLAGPQPS